MRMIDIAAAAGVSPSTVSRVINGGKNISPATIALVRRVMQEIGYRPDIVKSKRAAQEDVIFLESHVTVLSFAWETEPNLVCGLENLNQLSTALAKQGLQMTYLHWPWNCQLPAELIERSQGFVLVEGTPPVKAYRQLASKPVVSLFCPPGVPGDQILTGYYQVGQLAASYLLQQNIRHMILLHPHNQPGFLIEQGEGFKLFCTKEENITFEELIPDAKSAPSNTEWLDRQVQEMLNRILLMGDVPLGIFSPSCYVTALAYRYLYQRGIVPGKEIHFICSSHQMSLLGGLYPRPAVIDIGLAEMAEYTAHLLRLRIKNPHAQRPFQISVSPRLLDYKLQPK